VGIIVHEEARSSEMRMVGGEWREAKAQVGKSGEREVVIGGEVV
jgi:hypothetical protein